MRSVALALAIGVAMLAAGCSDAEERPSSTGQASESSNPTPTPRPRSVSYDTLMKPLLTDKDVSSKFAYTGVVVSKPGADYGGFVGGLTLLDDIGCLSNVGKVQSTAPIPARWVETMIRAKRKPFSPSLGSAVAQFETFGKATAKLDEVRQALEGCTAFDYTAEGTVEHVTVDTDGKRSDARASEQLNVHVRIAINLPKQGFAYDSRTEVSLIRYGNHAMQVTLMSSDPDALAQFDELRDLTVARFHSALNGDPVTELKAPDLRPMNFGDLTPIVGGA